MISENVFASAHERLDETLPGRGTVRERYGAWVAGQLVPNNRILPALTLLAEELRAHTHMTVGLPDDEQVAFELVAGTPWTAFAEHRPRRVTRILVNTDPPIPSLRLLELVAHEAYPGHHTEHVIKQDALAVGRGYGEVSVFLAPTPQALIAEGVAQIALECTLGSEADRHASELLRPLGIPYDARTAAVVRETAEALAPVRTNIAIALDERSMSHEQARAYARRWLLKEDDEADRLVGAIADHHWRPYESCYPEGLKLCRDFLSHDPGSFARLIREQLTPADLKAGATRTS